MPFIACHRCEHGKGPVLKCHAGPNAPVNIGVRKTEGCPLGIFPPGNWMIEKDGTVAPPLPEGLKLAIPGDYDPATVKSGGCCDPPREVIADD